MSESILHATVIDGTEEQVDEIGEQMAEAFPDKRVVVTDDRATLREVPALDAYVDEIAERVADKIQENE